MKHLNRIGVFFLLLVMACSSLPYKDDLGFLVSAQANSPEFPVYLNGHACKDMDGVLGLCSKRIKSTEDITLHFDPQPYPYQLNIACTSPLKVPSISVPEGQVADLHINHNDFSILKSFVCIGEVFPQDRDQTVSAKWEIRIVVTDVNYVNREQIFIAPDGKTLVLGQYARTSRVYDQGKWSTYSKKTMVELKDPKNARAMSESFSMRYNFFNVETPILELQESHGNL